MKLLSIKTSIIAAAIVFASCGKDALRSYDIEQERDAVESVNDQFLLASIIKQTTIFYQNQGFDSRRLPAAVQHMQSNYQGSDNTYAGFKQPITDMYAATDILKLVNGSIELAETRGAKSHQGIFTIFRALLFSYITDFYGDVYYTEALRGREGILYPKYDKQADIYTGLLAELEKANTLIAEGTETISPTYDLMYQGDKTKWQKFANTLRIRLLMRASNKISDAGAKIAAILGNTATPVFGDNSTNAAISYIGAIADNSWRGGTNNWSTDGEFDRRRPCKTLVDLLTTLNDPRQKVWFAPVERPWTSDPAQDGKVVNTTDPNGFAYTSTWEYIDRSKPEIAALATPDVLLDSNKLYVGFVAGMNGDYKNGNAHYNTADGGTFGNFKVSKFSTLFRQNSHPLLKATIMNSDEFHFMLAEAAAKGLITGNADAHYRAGITTSMKRWGIPEGDIAAYLAQPSVALPADKEGQLLQIAQQKWIALFTVSTEAYLDIRRTALPDIFQNGLLGTTNKFPLRYRYPGNELGQNKASYDQGVVGLSPAEDNEFSKMWLLQ
ncbi:MAG: SusD/RagB family nutrient-binding outer membrane lipoprotein [Agriterribacter sp.]